MKKSLASLLLILFVILNVNATNWKQKEQITQSNNKFCLDLFKTIDKENKNLVFSPFSISNALAMTSEITSEEIANAIRTGLKLPKDITTVRDGYQSILQDYDWANEEYQLNIANALWVENDYTINTENQQNVEKYYLGETLAFDNSQARITADKVNKWCDVKTEGMIKEILKESDINSNTRVILTNAIYFKGEWYNEFKEHNTRKRVFYNSLKKESNLDFLYCENEFAYTEDDNSQVLRMSYKGGDFSMLLILPKENDINSLRARLTLEMLAKVNDDLKTYEVKVYLPKFKFEFKKTMNDALIQLGMGRAFNPISETELYIGKVLHKAVIDVNEKGTEAAAVTAVAMGDMSAPPGPPLEKRVFDANHPFIFVIQDNMTKNILFMGKVENPEYED